MSYDPLTINSVYPVVSLIRYKQGWIVERKCMLQSNRKPSRANRPITELSRKSLSRLAFTVTNTEAKFLSLMTLTWPLKFPSDGRQVKGQLNHFLVSSRRKFGRYDYLWFLEFQKRGAPHIHILTTLQEPTLAQRVQFATIWANIVTKVRHERAKVYKVHRHTKQWEKIRSKYGAQAYALKYALKPHQKAVPKKYQNVGAFWRSSNAVIPKAGKQIPMTESEVRKLLRDIGHKAAYWDVLPKYIIDRRRPNE